MMLEMCVKWLAFVGYVWFNVCSEWLQVVSGWAGVVWRKYMIMWVTSLLTPYEQFFIHSLHKEEKLISEQNPGEPNPILQLAIDPSQPSA